MAFAALEAFGSAVYWNSVAEACCDSTKQPKGRQLLPQQFQQPQFAYFRCGDVPQSDRQLVFFLEFPSFLSCFRFSFLCLNSLVYRRKSFLA
jgi:hypothetical protein